MKERISRFFKFSDAGTNLKTETVAGLTTFMTMAYIIFVNPAILSVPPPAGSGMDFESVLAATCIASALTTLLMAFIANYPIALAPGMGMNALFSFNICGAMGVPWDIALGIVFLSGVLFVILTAWGIREKIFMAIPDAIKYGTATGIGLFIAFIGLKDAGIVVSHPETLVTLGDLSSPPTLLAITGFVITACLMAIRFKGAILVGIIITGLLGIPAGIIQFSGEIIKIPSITPTFGKLRIIDALRPLYLAPIFTFLFFAMFDAIGTLVGVGEKAGFIKQKEFPRLNRALFTDALGSIIGAICGTSTVTAYIESASGVAEGGRTGFANIITSLLFLIALFFSPIAIMFGGGYQVPGTETRLYPVTAPALIIVGSLMVESIVKIDWKDLTEAIPAFLTIIIMPLTFSISNGLALGFIAYPIMKLMAGKWREVHWLVYLLAVIFISRYIFL
ncbi:MAG: NCS2 family permease [Candidatus Aenigmatarchaeota archaeon]